MGGLQASAWNNGTADTTNSVKFRMRKTLYSLKCQFKQSPWKPLVLLNQVNPDDGLLYDIKVSFGTVFFRNKKNAYSAM